VSTTPPGKLRAPSETVLLRSVFWRKVFLAPSLATSKSRLESRHQPSAPHRAMPALAPLRQSPLPVLTIPPGKLRPPSETVPLRSVFWRKLFLVKSLAPSISRLESRHLLCAPYRAMPALTSSPPRQPTPLIQAAWTTPTEFSRALDKHAMPFFQLFCLPTLARRTCNPESKESMSALKRVVPAAALFAKMTLTGSSEAEPTAGLCSRL